jgi:hypothetical protein
MSVRKQEEVQEVLRARSHGSNVKGGIVGLGLFEKVSQRTYRLTAAGLAAASDVEGAEIGSKGKAERALGQAIGEIVSHPVFRNWLKDPTVPKHFRDAGHFWGIAPGAPTTFIRARILNIDKTLVAARSLLDSKNIDSVDSHHGRSLFDRTDLSRAEEFQTELKRRFAKELTTLGIDVSSLTPSGA